VIHEHRITTSRSARYYTLGEPGPRIVEVWFALHGYGQLAGRFVRELAPLDDGSRLIVAPEALSRFYLGGVGERPASERTVGASWMTREDRLAEIDDQVRYLDAVYAEVLKRIDPSRARVCVFGFSQGTATAARWLGVGKVRAGRLILWGGELPRDLDLSAERERFVGLDLTLVAGTRDQFITSKILEQEKRRLEAHGIPFHVVTFSGGHEIDEVVLRQVAG
jgi:predicted esterase